MKLKQILLKNYYIREFLFFIFHKKVNRKKVIKQILTMNYDALDKNKGDFIVSLTSFPDRIYEVQYTIISLFKQTIIPKKIYLWLAEDQFIHKYSDLPELLLKMQNDVFEIKWCKNLRSYKKLIPIIQNNIKENVIICDDDIYYRKKTLEILWKEHLFNEDAVICHIGKELTFDSKKQIIPYVKWNWVRKCSNRKNVLPIGGGCVLYPKHILFSSPLLKEEDLFYNLASYADDIWFWYSIIKAGYKVSIPKKAIKKMIFTNPEREYGINKGFTLTKVNEGEDMNDIQLRNIIDYFNTNLFEFTKG